jgi:excisionase family DNA binding protein
MSAVSSIPGYLTVEEAADLIGVDGSQVRRYCIDKKLPAVKVGKAWLIKRRDVQRFKRPPMGNPNLVNR